MEDNIKGKEYCFKLGEIDDEIVEDCREYLKKYCQILVEDEEIGKNTIGYAIGIGKKEISDEILFQEAICYYKSYLKEKVDEHYRHIIYVPELHEYD